ncbi:MAG: M48 family metallopeptidase [Gammaproteobacteria bacterium]|nr:M48 family metallopeptidase [Gammaproteobacteria bacterium]
MNFFEAQDRARKNTTWFVLLFVLAVAGLVVLTNLLLLGVFAYVKSSQVAFSPEALQSYYSWQEIAAVSSGVCLLIFCGSLYKTISLSGGGATVAEMLGGRQVPAATTDLQQRQLLNVVEEMAIAAGMPIPRVYLLEDNGINAFAAGLSPANAVIGVTRGTMTRLSREELQGVIAHEFSHIANGDMRLNIRLIGALHGILLIGLIGGFLLRSMRFSGRSRSRKGGGGLAAIAALGLGLLIIGYAGSFFGNWIKSIVSRQREFLADSSAVQFTRNKDGIGGALKKIGGSAGSYLDSPAAAQYSHAFFAEGVGFLLQSFFATHPPLEERIRRIEPRWDGEFLKSQVSTTVAPEPVQAPTSAAAKLAVTAAILTSAEQAISQVGTLNEENIEYVRELIITMPALLREAAQDAYTARALIYAVLIDLQKDKTAATAALHQYADPNMHALCDQLRPNLKQLQDKFKLPLLELSINALRDLSSNQYVQFKQAVHYLIVSDKSVNLKEWIIQRLLIQQLDEHFGLRKPARGKHKSLDPVKTEVETVLSLIALVEHTDDNAARAAFASGAAEAGMETLNMLARKDIRLDALNHSLDRLAQLKPLVKPRLLKACVAIILQDGKTTTRGMELVRTISTCLDCPMPPVPVLA